MIRTLMAAALAAAGVLPVAAAATGDRIVVAQGRGADGPEMAKRQSGYGTNRRNDNFDRLDRNHDGYVSRDEAKDAPELQTRFSELDVNNDGKLSREEYDALNRSASGATASGRGKDGSDSSTNGSNTK